MGKSSNVNVRLLLVGAALVSLAVGESPAAPPEGPLGEPPNIVVVLTDDQRWDTLCGGPEELAEICQLPPEEHPMPTVEALMAQGVAFSNAFATNPTCCPSRASLLSGGFYSHHTNVLTNEPPIGGAQLFSDTVSIATLLQEQGYQTALIGKYLNGYEQLVADLQEAYIPPGWDRFVVPIVRSPDWMSYFEIVIGSSTFDAPGTGRQIIVDRGIYATDYERTQALRFINDTCQFQSCEAPFFLLLSVPAPHEPAIPAPRHADLYPDYAYRDRGWGEQPDGDLTDKPVYVQASGEGWSPGEEDELHRNQLRSLKAVDEALQAIVQTLSRKGLLSTTVLIFASDNGHLWGEHKLEGKFKPYEESIRVPLIIRVPGIAPRQEAKLVSVDLDLGPTILEMAGVSPLASDGMSLLPLLSDPEVPWRDALLLEHFGGLGIIPTWAGIRTEDQWKYVEHTTGEVELYDLQSDPYELESKHLDPEYADRMAALAARLQQLGRGVAIRTDNLPDPQKLALPNGFVGEFYNFQLVAWGGNGEYLWSIRLDEEGCAQEVPPGLVLEASGLLTGTPTQGGFWQFCVKVEDTSQSPQPGNTRPQEYILLFNLAIEDSAFRAPRPAPA